MSLIVTRGGGFFSCCSIRLHEIIKYFNVNKQLPLEVDSKKQFWKYKNKNDDDITFKYFEDYKEIDIDINYKKKIDYHQKYQYKNYSDLDFTPFNI